MWIERVCFFFARELPFRAVFKIGMSFRRDPQIALTSNLRRQQSNSIVLTIRCGRDNGRIIDVSSALIPRCLPAPNRLNVIIARNEPIMRYLATRTASRLGFFNLGNIIISRKVGRIRLLYLRSVLAFT